MALRRPVLTLLPLCVAAGLPQLDEVSLLQVWSGLNYNEGFPQASSTVPESFDDPLMAQALPPMSVADARIPTRLYQQAPALPITSELSSLEDATNGIERQLHQVQEQSGALRLGSDAFSTLQASSGSDATSLKKMVQDLRTKSETRAGELSNFMEQQHITNDAVDHAKQQLQDEIKNTQQAWESEEKARASEREAWKRVAEQQAKDKSLETELQKANGEVQKMVQEREALTKKLEDLQSEATKANDKEEKEYKVSLLQAKQSEEKAWKVAKAEAEKALAEKKLKERLLTQAKDQLAGLKNSVGKVQKHAAEELKKEVQEVNKKVEKVKQEANAELRKASGQLHKEHATVQSVVDWAKQVQQQADAKMAWAKNAQKQVASSVNWAAVAKREAARASAAMAQIEELKKSEASSPTNQK